MIVTKIDSRTIKTYTLTVEDGEIRPQPYSRVGGQYQVDRVEIVKRDGNVSSATLHGSALKKDGSAGKNRASESLFRQGEWPEWLHGMVKGLA